MGLPVSLEITDCQDQVVFDLVFKRLKKIDNKLSTYKVDSELSRYQRKEITEANLSAEMKKIIKACLKFEKATDGYFSAWYGRHFDPTGYVKGWAINQASKIITKAGYSTYCIGAGGDVLAASAGQKNWGIGLQDPRNKQKIIGKITAKNLAIATSGNYQRGEHIYNPKNRKPAKELLSVSVAGVDIITADVLATACFAGGKESLALIDKFPGFDLIAITSDGHAVVTPGMVKLLA